MTPRRHWTRAEVLREAKEFATLLGYFPSCSELRSHGRNDLAVQISRHGGFLAIAKEVGIARVHSDSDTGWAGEVAVAARMTSLGFSVVRPDIARHPFDLMVNGCVRVDVKTASFASYPTKRGQSAGHFYRIGKTPTCDVVVLYASDTKVCYVIPWSRVPTSNLTITPTGTRYSQYRENWELITSLSSALNSLAA